jgi:antitoxin (DNA-binding transcriptional repressor) of toxin-antitoxin stability system
VIAVPRKDRAEQKYLRQLRASVTITNHGRPVAVLSPAKAEPRTFGQLPSLVVPDTFDEPLPADEIAVWEPAQ